MNRFAILLAAAMLLSAAAALIPKGEKHMNTEKATFAAGCFWHIEHTFRHIPGVIKVTSGYTGGHLDNPTYKDVCSDTTGHAEAVEITFDPNKVSYERLLDEFWKIHNPTTKNRQGPDIGSQYRSAIFYHSENQKLAAETSKAQIQKKYTRPVVTEITPAPKFWPAEEYHQRYLEKHGISVCPTK